MVQPTQLTGLLRLLSRENLLSEDDAQTHFAAAKKNSQRPAHYLVEHGLIASNTIAATASHALGVPYLDLDYVDPSVFPRQAVQQRLLQQHHVLPLKQRGNRLFLATSDPTDLTALDEVKFQSGLATQYIVVEEEKLTTLLNQFLESQDKNLFEGLDDDSLENIDIDSVDNLSDTEEEATEEGSDAPIVRFVNKVLLDAIQGSASDIHFEPFEKHLRIRFRIDGILYVHASPPSNLASRITARIKVMANLDISERRIPQDGNLRMKLSRTRTIDFRVNTCPTLYGEKTVLRLLDPSSAKVDIDDLGFDPHEKEAFLHAIQKPQGMVLVTGPTGSGKTISLYTALNIINNPEKNIFSAEDPVEIPFHGINQVHIHNKSGLTFAHTLRAFLRQDPDVIMVGEIRDLETAEIAIKAAQTGHLVLSTLHTNSAAESLGRLIQMGLPSYNIATAIHLIVAQRLIRILCEHCKAPAKMPPKEVLLQEGFTEQDLKSNFTLQTNEGCKRCTQGYSGRTGIFETMVITPEISATILKGGTALDIAEAAAKDGMLTLRQAALKKVMQGLTTLDEANRVTKE